MKTIMELMTALSAIDGSTTNAWHEAATISINCGINGAKDVYLAWGKEKGLTVKDLNDVWKAREEELRPAKRAGATGFAAMYYDWLATGSRSEAEARDLIMGNESQNVRNHLTHYLNIWALCETVRSGKPAMRTISGSSAEKTEGEPKAVKGPKAKAAPKEPEFVYDQAHPFACDKSAAETLMRQKNLVAKKRDLALLERGASEASPSQAGFKVILANTKKSLKIAE